MISPPSRADGCAAAMAAPPRGVVPRDEHRDRQRPGGQHDRPRFDVDVELTNPAAAADLEAERLARRPSTLSEIRSPPRATDRLRQSVTASSRRTRTCDRRAPPPCSDAAARNTMRRWSSRAARAIEASCSLPAPAAQRRA